MLRLVAKKDGQIQIDLTGSLPGRGAYVCYSEPCLYSASRRIEKALRLWARDEKRSPLSEIWEEIESLIGSRSGAATTENRQAGRGISVDEGRGISEESVEDSEENA